jgi:hypothetical protein
VEKVHDRESLARPDPEISNVWSRMMLRKRASAILVTTMMGLRVAMGTERPRAGLEGLEQTGELQAPEKTPTTSGGRDAARSRDGTGNVSKEQVQT